MVLWVFDPFLFQRQVIEASSSTEDVQSAPPVEPLILVGESGVEPVDPVIQSADPFDTGSLKVNNVCDEAVPENSHDLQAEGQAIMTPQPLGDFPIGVVCM